MGGNSFAEHLLFWKLYAQQDDQSTDNQQTQQQQEQQQPEPQPLPPAPEIPLPPPGMQGPDVHEPMPPEGAHTVHKAKHLPIIAIVVVIAMVAIAVYFIRITPHQITTSTSMPTTVLTVKGINGCGTISNPGSYSLSSDIRTSSVSGSCINITASNVDIDCNGHSVIGSGPYSGIPPFSYGFLTSSKNVEINDCGIRNFSYGIFSQSSSNLNISNDNVSFNYISNIYLGNVKNSTVSNNRLLGSTSSQGSIDITNGSSNNRISNNTVLYNVKTGIFVNSSGNSFLYNYINGSQTAFSCTPYGGLAKSNIGLSNNCLNNTGCAFLTCHGTNIPPNLAKLAISSSSVNGCGSINNPGIYTLQGGINMDDFLNVSSPASSGISCIYIKSNNVLLNCNNNYISNATTAITSAFTDNVTIENCRISTANRGVYLYNVTDSHINNVTISNSISGIEFNSSDTDFITNATTNRNYFGLFVINSSFDTVNKFTSDNNAYGVYLQGSLGNAFNSGHILNNTQYDVYATEDSANSTDNLMVTTACYLTDAVWAPCTNHITPNLLYHPITGCESISGAGNYSLASSVSTTGSTCFAISSSNVRLNCNGHSITATIPTNAGPAITAYNAKNITISQCNITDFRQGIVASNIIRLGIYNVTDSNSNYAFNISNVNMASIWYNNAISISNSSILLSDVYNGTIAYNNATYQSASSTSMIIKNSRFNMVKNNSIDNNNVGIYIIGNSQNNTILNNSVYGQGTDYSCSQQNDGLLSENGGINYGSTKSGCHWLAAITVLSSIPCTTTIGAQAFSLTSDYVYNTGSTCFSVYQNGTTLNCNGHTIIATDNGTLIAFYNAANPYIENCFIKGFTSPIISINSSAKILNNTVFVNKNATPGSSAVYVSKGKNMLIQYNNVSDPYYGITMANTNYDSIFDNNAYGGIAAYLITNTTGTEVQGINSSAQSGIGIILNNSVTNSFKDNRFYGIASGMECIGTSRSSSAGTDLGGNICSSQSSCSWIFQSNSTC